MDLLQLCTKNVSEAIREASNALACSSLDIILSKADDARKGMIPKGAMDLIDECVGKLMEARSYLRAYKREREVADDTNAEE